MCCLKYITQLFGARTTSIISRYLDDESEEAASCSLNGSVGAVPVWLLSDDLQKIFKDLETGIRNIREATFSHDDFVSYGYDDEIVMSLFAGLVEVENLFPSQYLEFYMKPSSYQEGKIGRAIRFLKALKVEMERHPVLARTVNERGKPLLVVIHEAWALPELDSMEEDDDREEAEDRVLSCAFQAMQWLIDSHEDVLHYNKDNAWTSFRNSHEEEESSMIQVEELVVGMFDHPRYSTMKYWIARHHPYPWFPPPVDFVAVPSYTRPSTSHLDQWEINCGSTDGTRSSASPGASFHPLRGSKLELTTKARFFENEDNSSLNGPVPSVVLVVNDDTAFFEEPRELNDPSHLSREEISELIKCSLRSPIPLKYLSDDCQRVFNGIESYIQYIRSTVKDDPYYGRFNRDLVFGLYIDERREKIRDRLRGDFSDDEFDVFEFEGAVDEAMEASDDESSSSGFDSYFADMRDKYEYSMAEETDVCIFELKNGIEMNPVLTRAVNNLGKPLIFTICEEWSGKFDPSYSSDVNEGFVGNIDALQEATEFLIRWNPFVLHYSDLRNQTYLHVLCKALTRSDRELIGTAIDHMNVVRNHPSSLTMQDCDGKTPLFTLCEKLHDWIDSDDDDDDDEEEEFDDRSLGQAFKLISTMMQRCPESTRVMSKEGLRALDKLMPHSNVPAVQDLIILMNRCLYPLLPFVSDDFTTEVQSSLKEEARHSKIGTRLNEMTSMLSKRTVLSEAEESSSSPTPEPADEVCEVLGDWTQLQLSKIDQKIKTIQDVDIPRIKKKYTRASA